MNFKVGDIVKTRDGLEVEVLKVDAPGKLPIVGMFLSSPFTGEAFNWRANGSRYEFASGADLLPPKRTREVTVWVNIYETTETVHRTQKSAERLAGTVDDDTLAVAVPHKFTLEW